jgi:single-strand DNA-binding protein
LIDCRGWKNHETRGVSRPVSDTFKVGNATRDPELRYTANGKAVASFGIAENRRRAGADEETHFFNVTVWGDLAENVAASIHKGTRVIVVGDLVQRSFETKEGEKRSVVEINAWNVGPDLSWATADVQRVEKESKSNKGGSRQAPAYEEEPF